MILTSSTIRILCISITTLQLWRSHVCNIRSSNAWVPLKTYYCFEHHLAENLLELDHLAIHSYKKNQKKCLNNGGDILFIENQNSDKAVCMSYKGLISHQSTRWLSLQSTYNRYTLMFVEFSLFLSCEQ